jgi:hypothetical protein
MADTMDAPQFLKEMSLLPVVRETIAFRSFFGIDSESNNVSADSSFDKAPAILQGSPEIRSLTECVQPKSRVAVG